MIAPRALGASLLVLGGVMYGTGLARSMYARVRELGDLVNSLHLLETEIAFTHTPLPEACEHVAQATRGAVRRLFRMLCQEFASHRQLHVTELWRKAVRDWAQHCHLHPDELYVLSALGAILGRSAADEQARSLRYTYERLDGIRQQLERDLEKQSRMRVYLGVAGGVVLAILLV